jgi:hypothetical protein
MDTRLLAAFALVSVSAALTATAAEPFVAHEWGTFTSVQGADGAQSYWRPSIKTDLPDFVYSRESANGGIRGVRLAQADGKASMAALLRMETPVIYFYSDVERDVDVRVDFPTGLITEWYPQAARVGPYQPTANGLAWEAGRSVIEWRGVKVLPRDTTETTASGLIRDREDAQAVHYYAARATDANFLRVTSAYSGGDVQHERDLFYRGVGNAKAPLTVTLDDGEKTLTLATENIEPLTDLFVLSIHGRTMRYQQVDAVSAGKGATLRFDAQPFGPLIGTRERVMSAVTAALERKGLYAKEARAMVATWRDQWFAEEGTRVLYLLPREWTDRTLPLSVSPQPDSIVRVMVGRAELLAPSRQRALKQQLVAFASGDPVEKRRAVTEARKLSFGRFTEAAVSNALGRDADSKVLRSGWDFADAIMAPDAKVALSR